MVPAALLNFLSGLAAGAGINMLTSIEGGSTASHRAIVSDSLLWIAVAVLLAYAAHLSDTVDREASLVMSDSLTAEERKIVIKEKASPHMRRYTFSFSLGIALTVVAAVFIPGLGI